MHGHAAMGHWHAGVGKYVMSLARSFRKVEDLQGAAAVGIRSGLVLRVFGCDAQLAYNS